MQCPLVSELWQQAVNTRLKMLVCGQDCCYLLSERRSLDLLNAGMLFPAALALGGIPLQVQDLNSTHACTDKQMLVFTFHPVEMAFSPLPSVMYLLYLSTHTSCPCMCTQFYSAQFKSLASGEKVS